MAPKYVRVVLPFLIIAFFIIIAGWLIYFKPEVKREKPVSYGPMVIVKEVERRDVDIVLIALGTVKPSQETILKAEVAGRILSLAENFEPGGLLQQGDLILQIAPEDYESAMTREKANLAKVKADYDLELGQQQVAKAEFEQLKKVLPEANLKSKLALRTPQLAQAKANLSTAETNLKQAELNLSRTKILAPYNALVTERKVSLGSQATASETLGIIVGTDIFWVEAAVPLDRFNALGFKDYKGLVAKVISATDQVWLGKVLRSIGVLDTNTRMGRILIAIEDPLGLKQKEQVQPLLLGDQVRVEITAGKLENSFVLPRSVLHSSDVVWVVKNNSLDIRKIEIVWKDTEHVYINGGLENGEKIIYSDLATPVQGMQLRLEE